MFARHKEKEDFHVRLQIDVLEQAFGPRMAGATSRGEPSRRNGSSSQNSSVGARQRGGSTSVGTGSRVPLEVEPDAYNSGVDEEKLYSDVIQNLRRAPRAENQDEAQNAVRVDDDAVGEDEDLAVVEWDPLKPHMEEGTLLASMTDCRNALVTYCIKVERTFKVDKSDQVRYRVHCRLRVVHGGCSHLKCEIARMFRSK
uniref:Uncharacterized protein n=1 Tax=Aegilops tauschii subsp. strangulata TaxID=200361 RepID=A0A453Q211_AEGTS